MNHFNTRRVRFAGMLAAMLLMAGCSTTTPPTKFYSMTPEVPALAEPDLSRNRILIGVGPIEVARYLERSQIVTRREGNNLELAEQNQWAEPIETNISAVIAANLARLLPQTQPIVRPWPDANVEHHVLVKFTRFDSDPDGNIKLEANWGIQLDSTRSMPVVRTSTIDQISGGLGYDSITQGMSLALATLSEEIAAELKKMIPNNG